MNAIVLFMLSIVPHSPVLRDSVEVLELNSFYDCEGKLVFVQLIGWEANGTVCFWRMVKGDQHRPTRDWKNGSYRVTFMDGDQTRTIAAPSFRESWTQVDVELENRAILPAEKRRELRKAK